MICVKKYEKLG